MKRQWWKASILALLSVAYSAHVLGLSANLLGNLIVTPPECILNNAQQDAVHFGDILLTRIDGTAYKHPVPLNLTCTHLAKNTLRITLQGEATSFNSNGALKTDNAKLGVAFYVNNTRQMINQAVNVNYSALPTIEAAPVKNGTATFTNTDGGNFAALATLKVDYQ